MEADHLLFSARAPPPSKLAGRGASRNEGGFKRKRRLDYEAAEPMILTESRGLCKPGRDLFGRKKTKKFHANELHKGDARFAISKCNSELAPIYKGSLCYNWISSSSGGSRKGEHLSTAAAAEQTLCWMRPSIVRGSNLPVPNSESLNGIQFWSEEEENKKKRKKKLRLGFGARRITTPHKLVPPTRPLACSPATYVRDLERRRRRRFEATITKRPKATLVLEKKARKFCTAQHSNQPQAQAATCLRARLEPGITDSCLGGARTANWPLPTVIDLNRELPESNPARRRAEPCHIGSSARLKGSCEQNENERPPQSSGRPRNGEPRKPPPSPPIYRRPPPIATATISLGCIGRNTASWKALITLAQVHIFRRARSGQRRELNDKRHNRISMIDCALSKRQQRGHRARDTISRVGLRTRRVGVQLAGLALLLASLTTGTGLAAAAEAKRASPQLEPKRELWAQLFGSLLGPELGNGNTENGAGHALEHLAQKLSAWPDQRRAALFYLDQLSRRVRSGTSNPAAQCRRVSLAELCASADEFPAELLQVGGGGAVEPATAALIAAASLKLNELKEPQVLNKLNQESGHFVLAAKLAVENANLISRLLIHSESDVIKGIASQRFFKYLLSSKLRQLSSLEPRLLHSVGLAFFGEESSSEAGAGENSLARVAFAPLAYLEAEQQQQVQLVDLAATKWAENGTNAHEAFLSRWLLSSQHEQALLASRLSSGNQLSGLALDDGRWFSPSFDCALTNRWLLTYSAPFFASAASSNHEEAGKRPVRLRGVSFASLDFARSGLIDQCATEQEGAFFANTHQCAARLKGSQCTRLANFEEARQGGYLCQCPSERRQVSANERQATSEHRDRLAELIIEHAANASQTLEQLSLEVDEQQLANDKSLLAQQLRQLRPNNKSSQAHLTLGLRLEADATLDWFSGNNGRPWPAQVCRNCNHQARLDLPDNEALSANSSASDECSETNETSSSTGLVRPLVMCLQAMCALLTLALVGILLRIRKSRIILVSGWLMLETTLLGAFLLYTSVFVRSFKPASLTCLIEPWLRELGFSIFYGSILIKLYRILTEFQTRKAHRVCFRDKDQIVYLLAIVLIVVGYMSAWTALMLDGFFFTRQQQLATSNHEPRPALGAQANLFGPGDTIERFRRRPFAETATLANHIEVQQVVPTSELTKANAPAKRSAQAFNSEPGNLALNYSVGKQRLTPIQLIQQQQQPFSLALAVEQLPEQLQIFVRGLNSFSDLFSGLLEADQHYSELTDSVTYTMRCRKLTWDYVTELSEMGLLFFGIYLVYKLRNASSEVHKEKLVLCAAIFIELFISAFTYTIRHALWNKLNPDQILVLYCIRCQFTVTLTIALIFGPKLWIIGKNRPTFFSSGTGNRSTTSGGSMRHRCHISCELHDHHLNDAMRLHQAMLSNSALDIGSINLADMDPDEIQAELKRVYAQLELLKTKVMRRDNPHISKRRGGRKTGHRKFSLQAFHAKHIAGSSHHAPSSQASSETAHSTDSTAINNNICATENDQQRVSDQVAKLPVLVENEGNMSDSPDTGAPFHQNQPERRSRKLPTEIKSQRSAAAAAQNTRHHHHYYNHNQIRQQHNHANSNTKQRKFVVLADPVSASSAACVPFDDDTLIMNDSQSSGNVSPQRQSSILPEESSTN